MTMFVLISIVHDYTAVGYMFIVSVGLFRQPVLVVWIHSSVVVYLIID